MEKFKRIACLLLVFAAVACSEGDEFPDPTPPPTTGGDEDLVEMTFTGVAPEMIPVGGDGFSAGSVPVLWSEGDAIAVLPQHLDHEPPFDDYRFAATVEGGASSTATFTGRTEEYDGDYFAFYPHEALRKIMYREDIYFSIPSVQQAVAGGFASGVAPMWATAKSGEDTFRFAPLCALLKFSVEGEAVGDIVSVRMSAGGAITGDLCYDYEDDDWMSDSPRREVTLEGRFVAGEDYYIVVAPFVMSEYSDTPDADFTFAFTRSDGTCHIRDLNLPIPGGDAFLEAGRICDLGTIDLTGAVFGSPTESSLTDMNFVRAVENGSMPRITFERDESGMVPLNDANLAKMASVVVLDVDNAELTELPALKYFTNVKMLDCSGNNLTELDVSEMPSLEYLNCWANDLTSLDFTGVESLTELICGLNDLVTLDVTPLKELVRLSCDDCKITELHIEGLSKLTDLNCGSNPLSELSFEGVTSLSRFSCLYCGFTSLDVRELTTLDRLSCTGCELTELNVEGLSGLTDLDCDWNPLTELSLEGLTALEYLSCSGCEIETLDVTPAKSLVSLRCESGNLKHLNVSGLPKLAELDCSWNPVAELSLTELPSLTDLSCEGCNMTALDVADLSALAVLYCGCQWVADDKDTPQTLTLTLTAAQRDGVWTQCADDDKNADVELNVVDGAAE